MTFRELRKKKFRTLKEFAETVGVSTQCVSLWECGNSAPRTKDIPRIAKILGVSVRTLVESFSEEKQ